MTVIYDAECPFCASYIRLSRLRHQFADVRLISAREKNDVTAQLVEDGYDLNDGMVVIHNDVIYYGAEAMTHLSLLSTRSDIFNRTTAFFVSGKMRAQFFYPVFKVIRKATLFVLGRKQI
ncbi:DCC1-like thiol-disulfide oxidoreductase family protein [Hyphococcus sp.]|uniref:DCC1-like thiol-disulfide oxidoreductase family protein n=1 Tax=Hyphococcus sp. TaxID=2038636 RepID=UPI003751C842